MTRGEVQAEGGHPVGYHGNLRHTLAADLSLTLLGRLQRGHVVRRLSVWMTYGTAGVIVDAGFRLCRRRDVTEENWLDGIALLGATDQPTDVRNRFASQHRTSTILTGSFVLDVWHAVDGLRGWVLGAITTGANATVEANFGVFADWQPNTPESAFSPLAPSGFAGLPSAPARAVR